MISFIKASVAKKKYGIPEKVYQEAVHGAHAIALRPSGKNGHFYFEVTQLESYLRAKMM